MKDKMQELNLPKNQKMIGSSIVGMFTKIINSWPR
jgi:hypothetical protein